MLLFNTNDSDQVDGFARHLHSEDLVMVDGCRDACKKGLVIVPFNSEPVRKLLRLVCKQVALMAEKVVPFRYFLKGEDLTL